MIAVPPAPQDPFAVLRGFAAPRKPAEPCERCGVPLPPAHDHLIEPVPRRLLCVCPACAVTASGREGTARVPREVRYLSDFQLSDQQWDAMLIPIEMAFFYHSSPAGRVLAVYPGPAGATESQLPLESWDDIVRANPVLETLRPDVEALVVNRTGLRRRTWSFPPLDAEHYLLPIDQCFRLVGLIRLHWKGLSGGAEVWREIAGFFAEMRSRAGGAPEVARA